MLPSDYSSVGSITAGRDRQKTARSRRGDRQKGQMQLFSVYEN